MTVATRLCLGFGAGCMLAALATLLSSTPIASAAATYALARDFAERTIWQDPPWRWTCWGLASSVALALSLGLVGLWLERPRRKAAAESLVPETGGNRAQRVAEIGRRVARSLTGSESSVVHAFEEIMRGALEMGASDIHISPTPEVLRVTYRVLGAVYQAAALEPRWAQPFATRIKVLSGLETHVRRRPQDGRLSMQIDGISVEARVSSLPTEVGERLVLRIVRGSRAVPELASLGLSEPTRLGLVEILARPQGVLFVTGPVGSGKTTTLYSALKHVVDTRGKLTSVVTLEDPIELELPFATQTQMHARSGRDFANTLRSVLRQDPNVLMIGEIRDRESAEIATQAGLTGHLLLTTLHADGAAGPFSRLIEMGVEPFLIASATNGSLSQRLVRTLCSLCARSEAVDSKTRDRFAALGVTLPDGDYHVPVGCEVCGGEGFAGRAPVTELLSMNEEVRQAIIERRPTAEILAAAKRGGLVPLLSDGLERALAGQISLAEVLRVTG
jgi:general secretion pathway protein E